MKAWVVVGMLSIQVIVPGFSGGRRAWPVSAQLVPAVSPQATPAIPSTPSAVPATGIPDEVQLVGSDADPTLRFPVCHSTWNGGTLLFHIKASYGWLEVRLPVYRSLYPQGGPGQSTSLKPGRYHFAAQRRR